MCIFTNERNLQNEHFGRHSDFEKLKDLSDKYLLHRTFVDNCTSMFPILKEVYDGKYIELGFSQNLVLRPKDEVQSAHFSGKQFTLHYAIVERAKFGNHCHINVMQSMTPSLPIMPLVISLNGTE